MNMINKLLVKELEIKSKLIQVLNEHIIEQSNQIDTYRNMMNGINDIMNNTVYIDI